MSYLCLNIIVVFNLIMLIVYRFLSFFIIVLFVFSYVLSYLWYFIYLFLPLYYLSYFYIYFYWSLGSRPISFGFKFQPKWPKVKPMQAGPIGTKPGLTQQPNKTQQNSCHAGLLGLASQAHDLLPQCWPRHQPHPLHLPSLPSAWSIPRPAGLPSFLSPGLLLSFLAGVLGFFFFLYRAMGPRGRLASLLFSHMVHPRLAFFFSHDLLQWPSLRKDHTLEQLCWPCPALDRASHLPYQQRGSFFGSTHFSSFPRQSKSVLQIC